MAKKITLTVNENLFRQIDAWRSSFNLSRLFQDAVSEAIRRKEEFQHLLSGNADIPRIVERLKAEKQNLLEKAGASGKTDGSAWAGRAHYGELLAAVRSVAGAIDAENKATEDWEARHKLAGPDGTLHDAAVAAYREGWKAGVIGLWDLVKVQLGEE